MGFLSGLGFLDIGKQSEHWRQRSMISVVLTVIGVACLSAFVVYEIMHAPTIDDRFESEHKEACDFRANSEDVSDK